MRASFRNRILFVGHDTAFPADPNAPIPTSRFWFTYQSDEPAKQWIVEATNRSAEHAAFYRSVYMRWAITINALNVARDRYAEPGAKALQILHAVRGSDGPEVKPLDIWKPETSVENYSKSIPLMAAYGIQDLFGAMEEIIFDLYEIYLDAHPLEILEGPDFREQRRLYRERADGPAQEAAWATAWTERMNGWRRKRIYDGLHRVFRAFWERSGLERSSAYSETDIDDWCRTIEIISELRNLLVHGENLVSQRLADLVAAQPHFGMTFVAGDVLEVSLVDIMIVERFFTDMIVLINESFMELAADGHPIMSMGRDDTDDEQEV
jgi:hypothetical protein